MTIKPYPIKLASPRCVGFTLVETLIALALMGMICISFFTFVVKSNAYSASMGSRYKEVIEVHSLIQDIMSDLAQGAYISKNSHKNRLEYTTYDSSGAATKKIYRITTISNVQYLQLSTDGGSTWGSPYRISSYTKYSLTGTPLFLYAQDANNCTSFTDTDTNGVWLSGTDAAGATSSCGTYTTTSPVLNNPSQSTKVVLSGFVFNAPGNPLVSRSLPSNVFMASPQAVVVSTATAVSPAVKDAPLFTSFDTATTNSLFGTYCDARGITWDVSHRRLIVVGRHTTSGPARIYQVERNGILEGPGLSINDPNASFDGVAILPNGQTILALNATAKYVLWYNLLGKTPLPYNNQYFNLANPSTGVPALAGSSNLVNSPTSIAYDNNTPNEFYVVGTDPSGGAYKIFEIDYTTGSLATTKMASGTVALPAAFDASHPPGGLAIEPTTGDFLLVRNYVNGSSPNKTIDIYRITSSGSSSSFSVNIDDLGSTVTGTLGYWGLAYNPESNHLFLTDSVTDKVYEVVPSIIISPRS